MPAIQIKGSFRKFIRFWLPVLLCMGSIFYASSIPASDIPPLFAFQDVAFHIIAYAIMAYFFSRALKNTYLRMKPFKIVYLTVLFGVAYGISDEFHQIYVPTRCASGFDLFIDCLGSLIGSLVYQWPR